MTWVVVFASCWVVSNSLHPMDTRLVCLSLFPRICSNSCPLSVMLSNYLTHPLSPSFPFAFNLTQHWVLFPMSQLFASGGQSIGPSASASVLMNIQGWFPSGLTGLILQSTGLSRVFSCTTNRKHQFFGTQPSLWSNSHIRTWLLEKP